MKSKPTQASSRKKFIVWAAAIISSASLMKIFPSFKERKRADDSTVKMLTREGKLVEIDKNLIASNGKKISNEQLQQWITKNKYNLNYKL